MIPKTRSWLLLTSALVAIAGLTTVTESLSQTAQQDLRSVPPGWRFFRGQGGLVVFHPDGWQMQERRNGAFLAYHPGPGGVATALVLVEPLERIDGRATGVVQGLGQIFPDLFPGVNVFKSRLVSPLQNPEVVVAEMQYSVSGQPYRGLVMCFKKDNRGVLYAIAASALTWSQAEPVMKQILSGFFYSGKTESSGEGSSTLPQMVSWNDPKEGAFACPVPQEWSVEGGLIRMAPLDTRHEIVVTSPNKKMLVRIGDASIPGFSLPNQMSQLTGITEGRWYSPDGLHKYLVMRYLPGASFLTQYYLPQRVGPVSNVRPRDYPEIAQKIRAQKPQMIPVQVDVGDVHFEVQTELGHRIGYAGVHTSMGLIPGLPEVGNWKVGFLAGYLAAPGTEQVAEAVLHHMVAGCQVNPEWGMQQVRLAGKVSEIWSKGHSEISDMIYQGHRNRSQISDRSHERWSRAFRGEVLIEDPNTRQRYEVPSGSNYYWRVGSGNEFVGTETHSPELPGYWLQQMRVID